MDALCICFLSSQTVSFNSALEKVFVGNASTSNLTIWCIEQTQTEWVTEAPAITYNFGLSKQNF